MSVRVFPLRYVPHAEAEDVRQALAEAGIEFYETPPSSPGTAGNVFGSQTEAIWIRRDADAAVAFAAIAKYQTQLHGQPTPQLGVTSHSPRRLSGTSRLFLILVAIVLIFLIGRAVGT
jgi:hypothetical protein